MISVDAFDLKILAALQDDGRLTNQQLADVAGLSASQCSRRRMRLEDEKVISGYHADLASEALGFNVIAFIHITLATHSPDNAKRFRALVNRVDEIQEAYSLTGDADYLLKAVLRDLKSLSDIVNNVLMPHQSVAHVRSSIVLDRLKERNAEAAVEWRCNSGRTANIATRTFREFHGSAQRRSNPVFLNVANCGGGFVQRHRPGLFRAFGPQWTETTPPALSFPQPRRSRRENRRLGTSRAWSESRRLRETCASLRPAIQSARCRSS